MYVEIALALRLWIGTHAPMFNAALPDDPDALKTLIGELVGQIAAHDDKLIVIFIDTRKAKVGPDTLFVVHAIRGYWHCGSPVKFGPTLAEFVISANHLSAILL